MERTDWVQRFMQPPRAGQHSAYKSVSVYGGSEYSSHHYCERVWMLCQRRAVRLRLQSVGRRTFIDVDITLRPNDQAWTTATQRTRSVDGL